MPRLRRAKLQSIDNFVPRRLFFYQTFTCLTWKFFQATDRQGREWKVIQVKITGKKLISRKKLLCVVIQVFVYVPARFESKNKLKTRRERLFWRFFSTRSSNISPPCVWKRSEKDGLSREQTSLPQFKRMERVIKLNKSWKAYSNNSNDTGEYYVQIALERGE